MTTNSALQEGRPYASDLQLVAPMQNEGLLAISDLACFTPTDEEHGQLRDVVLLLEALLPPTGLPIHPRTSLLRRGAGSTGR